jgi:ABC-type Na+ efflux pump permease subunit
MTGLRTVIQKEIKCFFGSDKSTFLIYAMISLMWSFALLLEVGNGDFWLVFFSVIVAANFSSTVFISERVNGNLEVLITSGLSRDAALFGKMIFIVAMTAAIGLVCALFAACWSAVLLDAGAPPPVSVYGALLYLSATFLNAAASAYFSVRLGNPRFLHFINLLMTGAFVAAYDAASSFFQMHPSILVLGFLLAGTLFTFLARREFAGERIIRPIIF